MSQYPNCENDILDNEDKANNKTLLYKQFLTPSSSESTNFSQKSRAISQDSPILQREISDNSSTLFNSECSAVEVKSFCQETTGIKQNKLDVSFADKVRMAIVKQQNEASFQPDSIQQQHSIQRLESSSTNKNFQQEYIHQNHSEQDASEATAQNSSESDWIPPMVRPSGGIKFSKSAASLPITSDSDSTVGDNISSTTPSVTSSAQPKMKIQDFDIIGLAGSGAYSKVYHVVLKIPQCTSLISNKKISNNQENNTTQSITLMKHQSSSSLSICTPGTSYALKVIEKKLIQLEEKQHEIHTEKHVLTYMKNHQMIKFYSSFQDKNKLYFLLEYVPNGSLHEYLKRESILSIDMAKQYSAEIVEMLEYLRTCQIVHRDLKPGNLIMDSDYHLKLCDFSTSRVLNAELASKIPKKKKSADDYYIGSDRGSSSHRNSHQRNFSLVGTEEYVSPEVLEDKECTYAADLWSLGIIIYQFLTSKTPFKSSTEFNTFENILHSPVSYPTQSKLSLEAKDLIEKLLKKNPEERLGWNNLDEVKKHPFFKGINFNQVREGNFQSGTGGFSPISNRIIRHQSVSYLPKLSKAYSTQADNVDIDYSPNKSEMKKLEPNENIEERQSARKTQERRRMSSFQGSLFANRDPSTSTLIMKSGMLRKKGLIFYNSRFLTLNAKGILNYYDPKNLAQPKAVIDLNDSKTIVKFHGKHNRFTQFEIITPTEVYLFKENIKGQELLNEWHDQIQRCIKSNCCV